MKEYLTQIAQGIVILLFLWGSSWVFNLNFYHLLTYFVFWVIIDLKYKATNLH